MTGGGEPLRAILDGLHAARPDVERVLFVGERPVPAALVEAAVGASGLERLAAAGLLRRDGAMAVPRVRLDRVEALVLASDLRHHRRQRDFVLGPGPAGFVLARHVTVPVRGSLLDLGTGCGIQGLLLADRATDALGLDINLRAVEFARFNAAINDRPAFRAEVGDFLGPGPDRRHDGRFQTVVANPPFVLSPSSELTYRDRPLPGDEVGARTVERVTRALARGGRGYVLCNWIDRGPDPDGPALAWARDAGAAVRVTRVGLRDPDGYAALWTRDLEPAERPAATARWAAALRAEGIEQIHLGVLELARRPRWSGLGPPGPADAGLSARRPRPGLVVEVRGDAGPGVDAAVGHTGRPSDPGRSARRRSRAAAGRPGRERSGRARG